MKSVILFRSDINLINEEDVARQYFDVVNSRLDLKDNLVIGRYSCLPYYKELENDLKKQNSKLINSYQEFSYIADFEYYYDLEEFTPKTYFRLEDIPKTGMSFILKGRTNSRKNSWSNFFAKDFNQAVELYCKLNEDSLISDQGIIIREYVELENFGYSVSNFPFANEWRLFFYKNQLLSSFYYWSTSEYIPQQLEASGFEFAQNIANIVSSKTNFFVIDIAKTKQGQWIVVELNDGQMSGLNNSNPEILYQNLKRAIDNESK
jgi:hypothetical protein